ASNGGVATCVRRRTQGVALVLLGALALGGCANIQFYTQAATGQASLLFARQDVQTLIDAPDTDPALVRQLRLVSRMLRFAEDELHLPVGGRYRSYVELDGVPIWNVVAAPEFAIRPLPRCYPLIGCAVYRGYFDRGGAEREAARLAVRHDVYLYPVTAYSTLGWFDDPILSSFVHYDEAALADLIFHELAHSVVYVPGDSGFNEGFASFVGNRGAIAYLMANGGDAKEYGRRLEHANAYARFLLDWRGRLAGLYREPVADAAKRQLKAELLSAMREGYRRNLEDLGGGRYDAAMARPFNNARLALVGTYEDSKRDFEQLFNAVGGDWRAFYRAVKELAALPKEKRWE
ncbi:MAG: aminopeptidase, partial [Gammaproteobacteria bacterium]|nr:aminopeptidase [Gammaproteobacteria bacterium]